MTVDPGGLSGLARQSRGVAALVQPGIASVAAGWEPRSNPEMKAALHTCRQTWRYRFVALEQVFITIGDKLDSTANTTSNTDQDSAGEFDQSRPQPQYRHGSEGGKEYY